MREESFEVHRDAEGETYVNPINFEPQPELVVSVNRKGEYAIVFNSEDDEFWTPLRVAGSLYVIADMLLERDGFVGMSDVQPSPEGNS